MWVRVSPLPEGARYGVWRGERDEVGPLNIPEEVWVPKEKRTRQEQAGDIRDTVTHVGVKGVAGHLKAIGPEGGLYGPIKKAIGAAVDRDGVQVNRGQLKQRIRKATARAVEQHGQFKEQSYIDEKLSDRALDSLIDWTIEQEIQKRATAPFGLPEPSYNSPEAARDALGKAQDDFFARCDEWFVARQTDDALPAPMLAVRATTGTGKTDGTLNRLLRTWHRSVHYFAPTHAVLEDIKQTILKKQEEARYENLALPTLFHIYGRMHKDKDGNYSMCKRGETAALVQSAGGDVSKLLCAECPNRDDCPFIAQQNALKEVEETGERVIYLMATDTLPYRLPGGVRKPDLVIIDESFWQSLVSVGNARPDKERGVFELSGMRKIEWKCLEKLKDDDGNLIRQDFDTTLSNELNQLWRSLLDSFEEAQDSLAPGGWFKVGDIDLTTTEDVERMYRLLGKCRRAVELAVKPGMSDKQIRQALSDVSALNNLIGAYRGMLAALAVELGKSKDRLSGAVNVVDGHVCFRRRLDAGALPKPGTVPTMILDADLDPEIVRAFFPHLGDDEVVDITCPWSEHVRVIQVTEPSFSKDWLISGCNADKHRADVTRFIRFQMKLRGLTEQQTMVISYKDAILGLAKTGDKVFEAESLSTGHFNAIAGLNDWKDCSLAYVMGRPQAPVDAYEDLARGLWFDARVIQFSLLSLNFYSFQWLPAIGRIRPRG
jgi:hypothetical protein